MASGGLAVVAIGGNALIRDRRHESILDQYEMVQRLATAIVGMIEAGWNALQFPAEYGGQGLPRLVATPVVEMWKSANLAFSLCPLLTTGAVETLLLRGSEAASAAWSAGRRGQMRSIHRSTRFARALCSYAASAA